MASTAVYDTARKGGADEVTYGLADAGNREAVYDTAAGVAIPAIPS